MVGGPLLTVDHIYNIIPQGGFVNHLWKKNHFFGNFFHKRLICFAKVEKPPSDVHRLSISDISYLSCTRKGVSIKSMA